MILKATQTKPDNDTEIAKKKKIDESSRNYRKLVDTSQKVVQKSLGNCSQQECVKQVGSVVQRTKFTGNT